MWSAAAHRVSSFYEIEVITLIESALVEAAAADQAVAEAAAEAQALDTDDDDCIE